MDSNHNKNLNWKIEPGLHGSDGYQAYKLKVLIHFKENIPKDWSKDLLPWNQFRKSAYNTYISAREQNGELKKDYLEKYFELQQSPSDSNFKSFIEGGNTQPNFLKFFILVFFPDIEPFEDFMKRPTIKKNEDIVEPKNIDENLSRILTDYGLRNTSWFLYQHYVQNTSRYSAISRRVLKIGDENSDKNKIVSLISAEENDDYQGRLEFKEMASCMRFKIFLNQPGPPKNTMGLKFLLLGKVNHDTLIAGHLYRNTRDYELLTNLFVMENVSGRSLLGISGDPDANIRDKNDSENSIKQYAVKEKLLNSESKWQDFIPEPIANYLASKKLNVIKTKPFQIKNLSELIEFIEDQKSKPFNKKKYNEIIRNDIFIVSSNESLPETIRDECFAEINNAFFEIKDFNQLKNAVKPKGSNKELLSKVTKANELLNSKLHVQDIYYPRRYHDATALSNSSERTPEEILTTELEAMKQSRVVIAILPVGAQLGASSALVKIGFAIALERPVIIFYPSKDILPLILKENIGEKIKLCHYNQISDIPNLLCNPNNVFKKAFASPSNQLLSKEESTLG